MALTVSAASINIDINGKSGETQAPVTYSGAAAIGAAGDVWNGYLVDSSLGGRVVSPAQSEYLVDSTGAATTVKFQIGAVCSDAPGGMGNALANDLCYVRSVNTVGDPEPPTSTTFALQGLQANGLYDVYLYAAAPVTAYTSSFTIGSTTKTTAHSVFAGTWVENTNYVKIRAMAGGDGSLQGTLAGDVNNDSYGVWGGLQVTAAVPEPSSIMLVVTGLFGLLCYAWRKR
jgi:hypothetical protein